MDSPAFKFWPTPSRSTDTDNSTWHDRKISVLEDGRTWSNHELRFRKILIRISVSLKRPTGEQFMSTTNCQQIRRLWKNRKRFTRISAPTPMLKTPLGYGTWPSPISADIISQQASKITSQTSPLLSLKMFSNSKVVAFEHIAVDATTREVLHSERRPKENRTVVVRTASGLDAIPNNMYAR